MNENHQIIFQKSSFFLKLPSVASVSLMFKIIRIEGGFYKTFYLFQPASLFKYVLKS